MTDGGSSVVTRACGNVALRLAGVAMGCVACCCDTCQEGSRRIEALPGAPPVRERDGSTAYVLYRKDRVACTQGSELLVDEHLEQQPATKRVVASCCNSALMMRFDDARHWIPVYRTRFEPPPAIQMRICTSMMDEGELTPIDAPSFRGYAPALMLKLLTSRIAMLFGA